MATDLVAGDTESNLYGRFASVLLKPSEFPRVTAGALYIPISKLDKLVQKAKTASQCPAESNIRR